MELHQVGRVKVSVVNSTVLLICLHLQWVKRIDTTWDSQDTQYIIIGDNCVLRQAVSYHKLTWHCISLASDRLIRKKVPILRYALCDNGLVLYVYLFYWKRLQCGLREFCCLVSNSSVRHVEKRALFMEWRNKRGCGFISSSISFLSLLFLLPVCTPVSASVSFVSLHISLSLVSMRVLFISTPLVSSCRSAWHYPWILFPNALDVLLLVWCFQLAVFGCTREAHRPLLSHEVRTLSSGLWRII